jgi:hypothetical protein
MRTQAFRIAVLGEHLNDAASSLRSVQRALGATDDFHAVEGGTGDARQVHPAARIRDWHAIEHDHGRVGLAAAEKDVGDAAVAAGLDDVQAGDFAEEFGDLARLAELEVGVIEDGGGDAGFLEGDGRASGGGDQDGFGQDAEFEGDVLLGGRPC